MTQPLSQRTDRVIRHHLHLLQTQWETPGLPSIQALSERNFLMCWGSCFCWGLGIMPCGTSSHVEQSHAVLSSCLPSTCPSAQNVVQTIASVICFCFLCSCLMVTLTLACRDIGQECSGGADFTLARFVTLPKPKAHSREKKHSKITAEKEIIKFFEVKII